MKIKCIARLRGVRVEEIIEVPAKEGYTDEEAKEDAFSDWEEEIFETYWEEI